MPERFLSPLRKAWIDPDGGLHEFESGHHMVELVHLAPDVPYYKATNAGWIRLTRRGLVIDIDGLPANIERHKDTIAAWSGPHTKWVNIDSTVGSFESSFETFETEPVTRMHQTARLTGLTVFRRRPVYVRGYRRP